MSTRSSINFSGQSGEVFTFDTQEISKTPTIREGVYVVTHRKINVFGFVHDIVYIGQSVDIASTFSDHYKKACFEKYEADCLCIHAEESESERQRICDDLIERYEPDCNC
jgi:hypothetical protein